MNTKMAKDLRSGDVILSGGESFTVRRVHGPTRKDWNHTTVYFKQGKVTTVISTTEFKIAVLLPVSQPTTATLSKENK